ncbi:MAG: MBOAT family protein [Treponema sp.]|jgi:D-alanyl-lipoteichoic acid acyltransferase DltB (MBOAT superfamily)|nr:MBOAT family protein [Treponema sp.]
MFFNSLDFALFLPIVFGLYWLGTYKTHESGRFQNILIVAASYVFYGWWDWRFLFLILLSTLTDYGIGLGLSKQEHPTKRKILLGTSILVNLLFLGFFKYYNFFIDTFMTAFSFLGMKLNPQHLHIILPVGISFYTFQTMSYSIDVYKKKLEPTRDFIAFAAFVSFFPQLVAGPIERAANLLPQFYTKRVFDYDKAVDGCKQMLWGFFKKMVIADNCAIYANMIFNNYQEYSGSTLVLGALFFTFQIYGDFSGYSDIAIGSSRLFGINLMCNFATPYFSRDMAEFWRRWHISLSTWFRDYVYIPLGGSRGGTLIAVRNTFIIFMLSGLWHGANWTFVFWGFLNGVYFLPLLLLKKNRVHIDSAAQGKLLPSGKEALSIMITFGLTVFGWIFFRAENIGHALRYIAGIFSPSLFSIPFFAGRIRALITILLIIGFLMVEWCGRTYPYAISKVHSRLFASNRFLRISFYSMVCTAIWFFSNSSEKLEFIYFQF